MFYLRTRRTEVSTRGATVKILEPEDRETVPREGAVDSVQEAELTIKTEDLSALWKAETLERLARAYWNYTSNLFLRLIRVIYAPDSTTVVLLSRRLPLLRFHAPEYETEENGDGGSVTWRIDRGLLVSSRGRSQGYLRIRARRLSKPDADHERVFMRVAVRNFYPWLRGRGWFARFGVWIYSRTQLAIHVVVCNSFLRSLADLDLPEAPVPPDRLPGKTRTP